MNRLSEVLPNLNELGESLTAAIVNEMTQQGHRATGAMVESVHFKVVQLLGGVELQVLYMDYGRYVELGRRAGAKRIPLDILMNWIRIKQIAVEYKEVKRVAFLIQRKIFQEGSPTRGSFAFSNNGRRKEFQLQVLSDNTDFIKEKAAEIMIEWFNVGVEGMVSELKRA